MPSALEQLEEARTWWLGHRDKALFDLLEDRPGLVGRPVIEPPRTRRAFLVRIRYYVYFQISPDEELVEILALWHASRGSGPQL